MQYKFSGIYTREGWITPAFIRVNGQGIITSITAKEESKDGWEEVRGFAIPGFRNAHSHAFQYGMAGIAERHTPGSRDDFWSWREAMYRVALTMNPEQMEKIAAFLYTEMLRHGYTHVAEFHYVHHDKNGKPYSNLAEMAERILSAAAASGIKLTLLPIFYQTGNFGEPPVERQRRFISKTYDDYLKLWDASKTLIKNFSNASLGVGVHSLRAVRGEDVIRLSSEFDPIFPFHIHVAEQIKEVDDCLKFYGMRPAQWLLENVELNENFHLVHATHLDEDEIKGIAKSRANVVLCPSTEGNLGDGIFRLGEFKEHGGSWSIGTDSHIGLNPLEELRLLDYRERLVSHQRNVLNDSSTGDCGEFGYHKVITAGKKAMGDTSYGFLDEGNPMDAVIFKEDHPLLAASSSELLLSTIIYTGDASLILGTMVNGEWVANVTDYEQDKFRNDFSSTIRDLGIRKI